MRVLIVGVSTRAAAESAARAGFEVIALDAYADLDQHPSVRALSLPREFGSTFSPEAVVAAASGLQSDAIVYLSNLENHPLAVDALAAGRALWGNPSEVLKHVRDPQQLAAVFARHGIRAPLIVTSESGQMPRASGVEQWLIKPRASGGGHGVRLWHPDEKVTRGHYLQEFVEGVSGSVVFVAAGGRGVALGVTRQLVGEAAFGVAGFRYCGSILNAAPGRHMTTAAHALVNAVATSSRLAGVGSIDFVASGGDLRPVEVNPRWSASMELVERERGTSMFAIHADACTKGVLPEFDLAQLADARAFHGKAVVFARQDVVVGDTRAWLHDPDVRDVPREGDRIAAGHPVCTVFAVGSDDETCHARLAERARRIYSELIDS